MLAIAAGLLLAWAWPEPGGWLSARGVAAPLLIAIFVCQGLAWSRPTGGESRGLGRAFVWGFLVSQVAGPALGLLALHFLPGPPDYRIGMVLTLAMAPTLVSGAVIAGRAGGDLGAALLLAVGLNLAAVFSLPLVLEFSLGARVSLDTGELLTKLCLLVLLPAVAGRLAARRWPGAVRALGPLARHLPVLAMVLIIYASTAAESSRLAALPVTDFLLLAGAAALGHLALLVLAYAGSRWVWRLAEPLSRAVAIVTSQKTLPLAVAVWSLALARDYPLSVLVPVVFHPVHIFLDGLIATRWARRPTPPPTTASQG